MSAGADRLLWRADTVATFAAEVFLDEPVFQRVEGDYRQAPAGLPRPRVGTSPRTRLGTSEQAHRQRQYRFNGFQFCVDGDAQSLERACGRVDALFLADAFKDQVGQLPGGVDRPVANNRAGDPAGVAFLALTEDDVGQVFLRESIYQVGGGERRVQAETHVQRPIVQEGEASFRSVQLHR